jgi:hypothetical protein
VLSARSQHGLSDGGAEPCESDLPAGEYFSSEQLLELAWKVAGATMAALGVAREDLAACGNRVSPIINDIVGEYGITIPESYRRR